MGYQFIDGYGSVLTADSSIVSGSGVSGTQRPIVNIASILTPLNVTLAGNTSVSGTVGTNPNPASVQILGGINNIGSVTAIQGTNPWTISNSSVQVINGTNMIGSVIALQGNQTVPFFVRGSVQVLLGQNVIGSVAALQSTNPWVIGNSSVMLTQGTNNVGSVTAIQGTNPWVIGNTSVSGVGVFNASVTGGSLNVGSVLQAVQPYAMGADFVSGVTSLVTGTTAVSVLAAPGANLRNYVTHIMVTNSQASVTGAGTTVWIKDTGANILYSGYAAAAGGGFSVTMPAPLRQPTTNASIDVVASVQASLLVSASGFKAA